MLLASAESRSWAAVRQERERQLLNDDTTSSDTDGNYAVFVAPQPPPPGAPIIVPVVAQPPTIYVESPPHVTSTASPASPASPARVRADALNATSVIQFAGRRSSMSPLAVAQRSPYKDRFPATTPPPHKIRRLSNDRSTDSDSDGGAGQSMARRSPASVAAARAARAAAAEQEPAGPSGLARTALNTKHTAGRPRKPLSQRRSAGAATTAAASVAGTSTAAAPLRNAAHRPQSQQHLPLPTIRDGDIIQIIHGRDSLLRHSPNAPPPSPTPPPPTARESPYHIVHQSSRLEAVQFYGANPPQRPRRILAAASSHRSATVPPPAPAKTASPGRSTTSQPHSLNVSSTSTDHTMHISQPVPVGVVQPPPPPGPTQPPPPLPTTASTRRRISFPPVTPSTHRSVGVDDVPALTEDSAQPPPPAASPAADTSQPFAFLRVVVDPSQASSDLPVLDAPPATIDTDAEQSASTCSPASSIGSAAHQVPATPLAELRDDQTILRVFQHGDIYQLIIVPHDPNPLRPFDDRLAVRQNSGVCANSQHIRLPLLPDFGRREYFLLRRYEEAVDLMLCYCKHFYMDERLLSREDVTQLLNFYLDYENVGQMPAVPWDLGLSQSLTMRRPVINTPANNFAHIRCRPAIRQRELFTPTPSPPLPPSQAAEVEAVEPAVAVAAPEPTAETEQPPETQPTPPPQQQQQPEQAPVQRQHQPLQRLHQVHQPRPRQQPEQVTQQQQSPQRTGARRTLLQHYQHQASPPEPVQQQYQPVEPQVHRRSPLPEQRQQQQQLRRSPQQQQQQPQV